MTQITELSPLPDTQTEASVTDRRRPGRRSSVSPELIPILRVRDNAATFETQIEFDETDELAGARGIAIGVVCSAPLWVGIAYLGRWLLS